MPVLAAILTGTMLTMMILGHWLTAGILLVFASATVFIAIEKATRKRKRDRELVNQYRRMTLGGK